MVETKYYVLSELAEANGLSARAVADAARAGKIVTYKPHKIRLVTMDDFDEYMKRFRIGPPEVKTVSEETAAERFLRKQAVKRARDKSRR